MAGNVREMYVDSPVFTREDEERYHYVNTEVEGLMTRQSDEDVVFESLVNNADNPTISASRDIQHLPGAQKAAEQPREHIRESMMRDSLECDDSDSNIEASDKNSIVIVNPSRYEDLTTRGRSQHAVQHHHTRNGRPDVVPRRVVADAEPRRYYLHDDAEEYEEAQLERQNQRREARRARVPHLELSHSDDEPSDGEAAFDLEINDGRGLHARHSHKHASHDKLRRVCFKPFTRSSNSADDSQLADSLEVAEYYPGSGADGGNPDYEGSSNASDRARNKNEPHDPRHSANSDLSVCRNTQTDQRGYRYNMPLPVQVGNHQGDASVQNSSAKIQQLSSRPQPSSSQAGVPRYSSHCLPQGQSFHGTTSDFNRRPDRSTQRTDFVEANRHNVNRKPQTSYGQMYSRKKGKENAVEMERPVEHRPVDSASSVSAANCEKGAPAQAFYEQNSLPPSGYSEESNVPSAEQLWQARSQSLAARKESAESLSGKNRRRKAGLPPNKVGRDPRVNDARPIVPQTTSWVSAPDEHRSSIQQFSTGSFTVPVQSEIPGSSPQKVSVDINLNVVSPRPLLNQPSTSLPVQYTNSPPREMYQYSPRTQAYTHAGGHYGYPATSFTPTSNVSQPFSVASQATAGSAVQYASDVASAPLYRASPHSHSTQQYVSSLHQQPMPYFVDSQGQIIPNQPVSQHLPIRYSYNYPQPFAAPVSDASQHVVQPYQMHVCSVKYLAFLRF